MLVLLVQFSKSKFWYAFSRIWGESSRIWAQSSMICSKFSRIWTQSLRIWRQSSRIWVQPFRIWDQTSGIYAQSSRIWAMSSRTRADPRHAAPPVPHPCQIPAWLKTQDFQNNQLIKTIVKTKRFYGQLCIFPALAPPAGFDGQGWV